MKNYTLSQTACIAYSLVVFKVILLCVVLRKKEEYNRAISRFWEVATRILQKEQRNGRHDIFTSSERFLLL